jgi:hypothetical protein
MGKARNTYRILVGKPLENRPLARPIRRWEDNIREVAYVLRIGDGWNLRSCPTSGSASVGWWFSFI